MAPSGVVYMSTSLNIRANNFILKGLVFGAFMWLFSFGWIRALPIIKLREVISGQVLFFLLFHLIYGLALGIFTCKWGDGTLDTKR